MARHQTAGTIFQEGRSLKRPPYFNGQYYTYWTRMMRTYVQSMDYRTWLVIQNGPLSIPIVDEGKTTEEEASTEDVVEYTEEQMDVMQTNARAKHFLGCAISREVYENIASCETAKEIWDKLEVTYEYTNKMKRVMINVLVHDYELFTMKENESVENMFSRFNKIIRDLKALGKSYSDGELVRKVLRSLTKVWQPKIIALEEYRNLDQMTCDELRVNLIEFEKIRLQRHRQEERRKSVVFESTLDDVEASKKRFMARHKIAGTMFQEGLSPKRPPYFNGQYYYFWKDRMSNFVQSMDYRTWLVIENGPMSIPIVNEGKTLEGEASTEQNVIYTKEQMDVLQTDARAMHFLYCAISGEVFEKISSCKTAKEIWDKLEVTYEYTGKMKRDMIDILVHEYQLFTMKENESIENMFTRFNKIIWDLKALGKSYSDGELVRRVLRSLPRVWQPKIVALEECRNLDQITYDELRFN